MTASKGKNDVSQPMDAENGGRIPAEDNGSMGYLSEIFCSIQGEGLYVGERQIFVRLAGCSVGCDYCDTERSKTAVSHCKVYGEEDRAIPNPLSLQQTVDEVSSQAQRCSPIKTVSITGGEPLEQSAFAGKLAEMLKNKNLSIHLETNGIEVDGLDNVIGAIDVISMDIKLPYAVGREYWTAHREFLNRISAHAEEMSVFVKIIVEDRTVMSEVKSAIDLIANVNENIPLVIQPETNTLSSIDRSLRQAAVFRKLLVDCQGIALERLAFVRVIPQCHKVVGMR
jgi:organic radical activating enzyme